MTHKILGYLLLLVGLTVMFAGFIGMYNTFVNRKPVLNVVNIQELQFKTQNGPVALPMNSLNGLLNISLFCVFMLFLATLGGKVALVGVNMLKVERIHDAILQLKKSDALDNQPDLDRL